MSDDVGTRELQARLRRLREEREWGVFHTPRSLTLAMAAEVGELAEVLSWTADGDALTDADRQAIADELADIASYALNLAEVIDVDLGAEVHRKIEETRRRFADLPPGTPSRKGAPGT